MEAKKLDSEGEDRIRAKIVKDLQDIEKLQVIHIIHQYQPADWDNNIGFDWGIAYIGIMHCSVTAAILGSSPSPSDLILIIFSFCKSKHF